MSTELFSRPQAIMTRPHPGVADDAIPNDAAPWPALEGCMVLVAAQDLARAFDLAEMLRGLGSEVLGPVRSTAEALELLAHQRPNMALLDAGPGCQDLVPLAQALTATAVPFALMTRDTMERPMHPALADVPRLARPCYLQELGRSLQALYRLDLERRLALDEAQIAAGRERLACQVRAIERLAAQGEDALVPERLLRGIGRSLRLMRAHRAYLLRRLAANRAPSGSDGRMGR